MFCFCPRLQSQHEHVWVLRTEVNTEDAAVSLADKLWVGRILQGEHTGQACSGLPVEIVW